MHTTPPGAEPRPTDQFDHGSLDAHPIDGLGVEGLTVHAAETTGDLRHACRLKVYRPATDDGQAPHGPSLVLAHPPRLDAGRPATPAELAHFEYDGQTFRAQVRFPAGTSYYGLGEVAGRLLRNGRIVNTWNTDSFAYGEHNASLYQSHPYVLAVLPDGRSVGCLADTPRRGRVHVASDGFEFAFEAEPFDLVRIEGDSPAEVSRGLAALTGRMAEPPAWALGYHQCRYSYATAEEVREVVRGFAERDLPLAAIWFDIHYMDRYRVFTWDRERFPDPAGLIAELHDQDVRAVAILDPGIAVAEGYEPYESGLDGDHFVELPSGRVAQGRVWPGRCVFPDFTRTETRAWWAARVQRLLDETGLDGLWCDMNEPALFRTPTKTLPDDAVHRGLGGGPHARFHNVYGHLMTQATWEGFRAARPEDPPFVLTRSGHLSTSRFAATWTGDNLARWEDLAWAVPMVLSLGLSGQPFSGPDVGGFFGDPEPELFERWFELGPWLPFFRGHGEVSSCRKEPWSFGEEVGARVGENLRLRERLVPLFAELFREASTTGLPVCRPLFFADPQDAELRAIDDQMLVGADVLVAPALEPGQEERRVRFPSGRWLDLFDTRRVHEGEAVVPTPLGRAPAFAREGSAAAALQLGRR